MGLGFMKIRKAFIAEVLAANIAAVIGPASAQTIPQDEPSRSPVIVYVQASDARFESYLYLKKSLAPDHAPASSDEFFYIPLSNSKERERELANWRRKFNSIVSAATLSERVQPKISHVKDEFSRAISAAECWTVDNNRERRITITMIGSANKAAMENEYKAASRDFFANPANFTCKYTYKLDSSTPEQ
jgi:hypothetical protein